MDKLNARSCSASVHESVMCSLIFILFLNPLLAIFLQVVHVELAGNDASSYEKVTDCKMASWMIILVAIAGAVGLFLMLLACCCVSFTSLLCLQRYKSTYECII